MIPRTILSALMLLLVGYRAEAACTGLGNGKFTIVDVAPFTGIYVPGSPGPVTLTGSFTFVPPVGMGLCRLAISVEPNNPTHLETPGGATLPYTLGGQFAYGFGGWYFSQLVFQQPNYAETVQGTVTVNTAQAPPAGAYSAAFLISLHDQQNGLLHAQATIPITLTVTSSCTLPAPDVAQLDFSAGIALGRVNQGYRQTAVIANASCTGPSTLTVRSAPMLTNTPASPTFTNAINLQATARFGAAQASFSTATAAQASVTVPAGNGTVGIDVTLVDGGKSLAAGQYSSALTVILAPAN